MRLRNIASVRIALLTATALALALAAAGLTTQAPAATPLVTRTPIGVASAALTVQLHASTRNALQLHGVLFQAQPSASDISTYVFAYGDGTSDASYQAYAMHGYRQPGTYQARVGVFDASGQLAVSTPVTIHVRDGIPPVVRIERPRPDQRLRLAAAGIRFAGSAHDSDGVTEVQLAIQLVSSAVHFQTHGGCIWYDGHTGLVLTACSNPHFFTARSKHGQWSFRMSPQATLPAGRYAVRVRAIDRAGNVSSYYALVLRTILPFELVR